MIFASCPNCGHKLLEGEIGSRVQVKCNKCGSIIKAQFDEALIGLKIIKNNLIELKDKMPVIKTNTERPVSTLHID